MDLYLLCLVSVVTPCLTHPWTDSNEVVTPCEIHYVRKGKEAFLIFKYGVSVHWQIQTFFFQLLYWGTKAWRDRWHFLSISACISPCTMSAQWRIAIKGLGRFLPIYQVTVIMKFISPRSIGRESVQSAGQQFVLKRSEQELVPTCYIFQSGFWEASQQSSLDR